MWTPTRPSKPSANTSYEMSKRRLATYVGRPCVYCDQVMMNHPGHPARRPTRDHVRPKSKGGNSSSNVVIVCRRCNQDKGSIILVRWMLRLYAEADPRAPIVLNFITKKSYGFSKPLHRELVRELDEIMVDGNMIVDEFWALIATRLRKREEAKKDLGKWLTEEPSSAGSAETSSSSRPDQPRSPDGCAGADMATDTAEP